MKNHIKKLLNGLVRRYSTKGSIEDAFRDNPNYNFPIARMAVILGLVVTIASYFWTVFMITQTYHKNQELEQWPNTSGTIVKTAWSKEVRSNSQTEREIFVPELVLEYFVSGKKFKKHFYGTDHHENSISFYLLSGVEDYLRTFSKGQTMRVYYSPESPRKSRLNLITEPLWPFLVFSPFLTVSWILFTYSMASLGHLGYEPQRFIRSYPKFRYLDRVFKVAEHSDLIEYVIDETPE
jgi:hypothetical protein